MIGGLIKSYFDFCFTVYAYVIGYIYMAPVYVIGLLVSIIKKIMIEYETDATMGSMIIISIISGTIYSVPIFYFIPMFAESLFEKILWFVGYVLYGYFALFLLADKRMKQRNSESVE